MSQGSTAEWLIVRRVVWVSHGRKVVYLSCNEKILHREKERKSVRKREIVGKKKQTEREAMANIWVISCFDALHLFTSLLCFIYSHSLSVHERGKWPLCLLLLSLSLFFNTHYCPYVDNSSDHVVHNGIFQILRSERVRPRGKPLFFWNKTTLLRWKIARSDYKYRIHTESTL